MQTQRSCTKFQLRDGRIRNVSERKHGNLRFSEYEGYKELTDHGNRGGGFRESLVDIVRHELS